MNATRNGKIARLPHELREHLNHRLLGGEQGKKLIAWLNTLPETRAVLVAEFGGRPINKQNLTEWRQGGYRDWLDAREARELAGQLAREAITADPEGRPPLTENLAHWVVARYVIASERVEGAEGAAGWRLLREMCLDVSRLRRGDHSSQRLQLRGGRLPEANPSLNRRRRRARSLRSLASKPPKWGPSAPVEPVEPASPGGVAEHWQSKPVKPNQTVECRRPDSTFPTPSGDRTEGGREPSPGAPSQPVAHEKDGETRRT